MMFKCTFMEFEISNRIARLTAPCQSHKKLCHYKLQSVTPIKVSHLGDNNSSLYFCTDESSLYFRIGILFRGSDIQITFSLVFIS